jgi:hypothetical protein
MDVMPNLSLQAFAAAQFAGQQLNTELDNRKADTEMKQQQIAQGKNAMALQQQQQVQQQAQQAQMSKLIESFDKDNQTRQVEDGTAPDNETEVKQGKQAELYDQIGKTFLFSDPSKAESWMKMAEATRGKMAATEEANLRIGAKRAKDTASYAGTVLDGTQTPEQAFQWVKDNVSLKDALTIPTDPLEAKNWWKSKQTQGLSASEQLQGQMSLRQETQRIKEHAEAAADRRQNHADGERDLALSREILREGQASRKEEAALRHEERKAALEAKGAGGAAGAGGNIQFRHTVAAVNYAAESLRGLDLVGEMAKGQSSGVFGHLATGEGIPSALAKTGGNRLTNQEQQMYQAATKGLGLELAQLATSGSGRGANQAVTKELNAMIEVIPGDTQYSAMYKLANAADFVRTRMKAIPKSTDPTIQKTREEVDEALKKYPSPSSILQAAEKAGHKISEKTVAKRQTMMEALRKAEASAQGGHPPEIQDLMDKYK